MRTWRVVGISFEHIHMGDLLREVHEHPNAEIAGVCDPDRTRMADAIANFSISPDRVYDDIERCIREARPNWRSSAPRRAPRRLRRGGRRAGRRHPAREAFRSFAR